MFVYFLKAFYNNNNQQKKSGKKQEIKKNGQNKFGLANKAEFFLPAKKDFHLKITL